MRKRRSILIVPMVLLIAAALAYYFTRPKEPTYKGVTLTKWLEKQEALPMSVVAPEFNAPGEAIQSIGSNAIPKLLELLQSSDPPATMKVQSFIQSFGWRSFRVCNSDKKHRMATAGFYVLGSTAESATPALIELLEKKSKVPRKPVLLCLLYAKPPKDKALPSLIRLLRDPDGDVQALAAECIWSLYPEEAEIAGVYKLFPILKRPSTNTLSRKTPSTGQ